MLNNCLFLTFQPHSGRLASVSLHLDHLIKGHHTPHLGQFSTLSAILTWSQTHVHTAPIPDTFLCKIGHLLHPRSLGGSAILSLDHNPKWQTTIPDTVPDVVCGGVYLLLQSEDSNVPVNILCCQLANFCLFWSKIDDPWDQCKSCEKILLGGLGGPGLFKCCQTPKPTPRLRSRTFLPISLSARMFTVCSHFPFILLILRWLTTVFFGTLRLFFMEKSTECISVIYLCLWVKRKKIRKILSINWKMIYFIRFFR